MILPRLKAAAKPNSDTEDYSEEPDVDLVTIPTIPEVRSCAFLFWSFLLNLLFTSGLQVPGPT